MSPPESQPVPTQRPCSPGTDVTRLPGRRQDERLFGNTCHQLCDSDRVGCAATCELQLPLCEPKTGTTREQRGTTPPRQSPHGPSCLLGGFSPSPHYSYTYPFGFKAPQKRSLVFPKRLAVLPQQMGRRTAQAPKGANQNHAATNTTNRASDPAHFAVCSCNRKDSVRLLKLSTPSTGNAWHSSICSCQRWGKAAGKGCQCPRPLLWCQGESLSPALLNLGWLEDVAPEGQESWDTQDSVSPGHPTAEASANAPATRVRNYTVLFTEPQHGRGWQGPLGIPQPNPPPKQGHPEQAAQHRVQAGLKYLQRRRLHSLPGQPGPGLRHPQREEVLPCTVNPPLPSLPQTTLCSVYPSR